MLRLASGWRKWCDQSIGAFPLSKLPMNRQPPCHKFMREDPVASDSWPAGAVLKLLTFRTR
jgi:hypothetical protein